MRANIGRRQLLAALGGAAAWPLAPRAQQRAMPVIAYLSSRTADSDASMLVSVRRGLADVGYAEGRNVAIEYRFTDGRYDPLSAQLTDLTQRKVGVIVFVGPFTEELLQQVRTSPTPIVFVTGSDARSGPRRRRRQHESAGWQRDRRQYIGGRAVRKATGPSARPRSQSCDDCRASRPEGAKPGNHQATRRARRRSD